MRDDAIYCEYPAGADKAYISFMRHEQLRTKDRRIIKGLVWAVGALCVALIVALVIR